MGTKPRVSLSTAAVRRQRSKPSKPCGRRRPTRVHGGASVSDRLEALQNLLPHQNGSVQIIKPDQLYKETAEYIMLLKTQVLVLQKLVEFYGSSSENNINRQDWPDASVQ